MKVLIDTNVFLSYLLASVTPRTITTVVRTCLEQEEIELLVPSEQIQELADKASTKDYFRTRIQHAAVQQFIQELTILSELPPLLEDITPYSRDPNDDYLVAYGVVNEADYLITGDQDLLVLARVGALQIVLPSQFLQILRSQNLLP